MTDRRVEIADAGIRILASRGARAFTHLTIDRELRLPDGSTSYYARTRRDLISLVVEHLATRTSVDLVTLQFEGLLTPGDAASMIVAALDAAMQRVDENRARLVLLLECQSDPELQAALATRPSVRSSFVGVATALLRQLETDQPEAQAHDLVGLIDALLMQRTIRTAPINENAIVAAYLTGLRTYRTHPL